MDPVSIFTWVLVALAGFFYVLPVFSFVWAPSSEAAVWRVRRVGAAPVLAYALFYLLHARHGVGEVASVGWASAAGVALAAPSLLGYCVAAGWRGIAVNMVLAGATGGVGVYAATDAESRPQAAELTLFFATFVFYFILVGLAYSPGVRSTVLRRVAAALVVFADSLAYAALGVAGGIVVARGESARPERIAPTAGELWPGMTAILAATALRCLFVFKFEERKPSYSEVAV